MAKKIIIAVVVILLLAALSVGIWYFLCYNKVEYKGDVDYYDEYTLTLRDNVFYDVYVPREAELLETDEYSTYRFDLLTISVQEDEPLDTDFKVNVDDRWVVVRSEDNWYAPTLHGFEQEEPYTYDAEYEYLTYIDEETGEEKDAIWNDGPAPESNDEPSVGEGATVYELDNYVFYHYELLKWEDAVKQQLNRLCFKTDSYIPHYYDDGNVFYAEVDDYVVGAIHDNYNGQWTVIGKGDDGIDEALAILTKGLKTDGN